MDIILGFLVGMALYLTWFKFYRAHRELQDYEQKFREYLGTIIHIVRQEQVGDTYYWYDNDDNIFLAQGNSLDDIIAVLKSRFPDHIFVLNEHEMIMGPEFKIVQFDIKTK